MHSHPFGDDGLARYAVANDYNRARPSGSPATTASSPGREVPPEGVLQRCQIGQAQMVSLS